MDDATDDEGALHRALVDASTDGLWIFDGTGTTTWANDRMAELLGVDPGRMAGFRVEDALDREGREQLPDHLAAMAAAEVGQDNVESKFVRADGTEIWTLVSWSPLRDHDGRRVGWLHRVTEYTDRRALLDTLRDREQQLATAQSIAHIGSWSWDVPTNTVTWSAQLYRIYNLEPDEHDATYEGFLDRIHPEDRDRVRAIVGSTFAGADEFAFDSRIIRRGGEVRWIRGLGRVQRAADGTPLAMGGTTQDITDLKRADQLAAEATRRLELLQGMAMAANQATNLAEAIATMAVALPLFTTWTAVGVYTVGADGALAREPLDSSGHAAWEPLPDPALAERARLSRQVEIGAPSDHADTHSLVAIPVLLAARAVAVIEVLADEVPPDENSMFLIGQIAGQLSLVAERERSAQELAEARDEAMEASRLKSEFLATMSHEIRTPMNGVIGLNELLLGTELDDHQRRLAEGLQRAGLTLLGIINDILDLSKIESGKLELEAVDFDVRGVFEQSASVLSGPAHAKGLELIVACHPDVPLFLRGDSVRFGQVLTNLGSNAVKFTDDGEVVVSARVERESAEEVVLRVDVVDSGVGIDPAARATLFDAFTQADPSTTRRHGGTGLGLAISRQLVEALGGEIEVSSEVGRGSTFSFTAAFGRAGGAATRRSPSSHGLQGRRVLVVDDNETNRLILTEQLAAWQMDVAAASSATEAMAALRDAVVEDWPFEIVLLDLVMPDTDGLALARRIGAEPELGGPAMLLLSSNQGVRPQAVRDAGVHASLEKPVRHSELYDALVGVTDVSRPTVLPSTAPRSARPPLGLRVLVVEDNQVNQLVATGLLENLGFEVEVASDGEEAVDRLATDHDFAAVLMDCRMPLLDGFDATRAVRAAEPEGRRVPDHRDDGVGTRGRTGALPGRRHGRLPDQARRRRRPGAGDPPLVRGPARRPGHRSHGTGGATRRTRPRRGPDADAARAEEGRGQLLRTHRHLVPLPCRRPGAGDPGRGRLPTTPRACRVRRTSSRAARSTSACPWSAVPPPGWRRWGTPTAPPVPLPCSTTWRARSSGRSPRCRRPPPGPGDAAHRRHAARLAGVLPRFEVVARRRPVDLVSPGAVLLDRALASGWSAPTPHPAPYAAVTAALSESRPGRLVLELSGGQVRLVGWYDVARGTVGLEVHAPGHSTTHRSRRHGRAVEPASALGLTLTGTHLTVLTRHPAGWVARGRVDLRDRVRTRDEAWLASLTTAQRWEGSTEPPPGRVVAGGFGQLGLRDLRLVTERDGTAYRLGGRLLLTATSAGPGFFDTAHTSVWTLDPATYALTHRADLFFRRPGLPGVFGDHATHLLRDAGRWVVATSTWGDFDRTRPGATVAVTLAETDADLLHGRHVLDTRRLSLPTEGLRSVGVWDPHLVHADGRWLVGYVSARKFFRFHPALAEGPDLDTLSVRGSATDRTATEGTTLVRVDGAWRVLASDGREGRRGQRRGFPVFDLDLAEVGSLEAPYPTNIPWPTLVELEDDDWLMVAFNGAAYGGPLLGYGTHGEVVLQRTTSARVRAPDGPTM